MISDPELTYRRKVISAAEGEIGLSDGSKYWQRVLLSNPPYPPNWCGGFALWALREAGLASNIYWPIGSTFLSKLPITVLPSVGDIAYFSEMQHHAIVKSVNNDTVELINGNGAGGKVTITSVPKGHITAFYSIKPLIEEVL